MSIPLDSPSEAARVRGVTRTTAVGIARYAGLSAEERNAVLALPFPADEGEFWQTMAGVGVTRSGLMDSLGASP